MARHPRLGRGRSEPRLDPIRWRRPTRGASIRLVAVAALLALAAAVIWSRPETCAPPLAVDSPAPVPSSASSAAGQGNGGRPAVPPGLVGVPVRLAEPTALTLVRPGDRVDLLRVDDDTAPVAAGALVLSVTDADDPTSGGLLLALRPAEAEKAVAAPDRGFAVLIRPG